MSNKLDLATPMLEFLYQEYITKYKTWASRQSKERYGVTTLICSPEIADRLGQVRAAEWDQYVHARDVYILAAETGKFPRIN